MTDQPGNETALRRLLYTSQCLIEGSPEEKGQEVRRIAEASEERNRRFDLTGALLFVDDSFIQVLEGPSAGLEAVFEEICCDLRHRDVKLIDLVPVESRMFADWAMAVLSHVGDTQIVLRNDLQDIRLTIGVNAREAERQMRALLDAHAPEGRLDRAA